MPPYERLEDIDDHFESVIEHVVMVHERGLYKLSLLTLQDVGNLWLACRGGWIREWVDGFMVMVDS